MHTFFDARPSSLVHSLLLPRGLSTLLQIKADTMITDWPHVCLTCNCSLNHSSTPPLLQLSQNHTHTTTCCSGVRVSCSLKSGSAPNIVSCQQQNAFMGIQTSPHSKKAQILAEAVLCELLTCGPMAAGIGSSPSIEVLTPWNWILDLNWMRWV